MSRFKVGKTASDKRRRLRDSLWPHAEKLIWNRKNEHGFTTLPRTLPLVSTLIKELSPQGDASRVYEELWFRAFDEGFVEITDEEAHAFASGYVTPGRGVRSWRERMEVLIHLGLIRVQPNGSRKYGYVLLKHPDIAVEALRKAGKVKDAWYNAYSKRMVEIGAEKVGKPK